MVSGKTILIVVLAVVLVGVVAAVSVWRTNLVEGNRKAAAEAMAVYERKVDSLSAENDSLRARAYVQSGGSDTMFVLAMMRQIDTLRTQVMRMSSVAQRLSGSDSIAFYLGRLADTSFYSFYGDYQEPKRWYISPEWFGMLGRPGIAPLVAHLDSARGFELSQTLYALLLASQHESVKAITQGDMPPRDLIYGTPDDAVLAWRRWANKWGLN